MERIASVLYEICDFIWDFVVYARTLLIILGLLIIAFVLLRHFYVIPELQKRQAEWDAFLATVPKTMCVDGYEYEAVYRKDDNQAYAKPGTQLTESVNGYTVYKMCNPYSQNENK